MDMSGKTVIITGASRGIGAEAARVFASAGANVALLARSQSAIADLAGEIGEKALAIPANVARYSDLSAAVDATVDAFGSVDLLQIRSSVKHGVGESAVDEIFSEIQRLVDQPLSQIELNTIKNTFFGQLQRIIDGSLRRLDALSYLLRNQLSPSHFHEMLELLEGVSPEDLQQAAAKHLKKDDFLAVVVEGQETG